MQTALIKSMEWDARKKKSSSEALGGAHCDRHCERRSDFGRCATEGLCSEGGRFMARVIRRPDAMAAFNAPCHSSATNAAKTLCGGGLSPSDSKKQKTNVAAADGAADFAADGVASD